MTEGRGHGALVAALSLFLVLIAVLHQISTRFGQGIFTYPLDDTYIHLALAKHFATGHGWGINADRFASCSSSPLWTMLLSAWMGVFGVGGEAPLLLATLFGMAAVVIGYRALQQNVATPGLVWAALGLAIVAGPLATLSLSGLEHALQTALTLAFVVECADQISRKQDDFVRRARLAALALLLGGVRYESLLLVGFACLLFAVRFRKLQFSIVLGLAGLAPVLAFGMWSRAHGWFFVPNSVLLKANVPTRATSAARELVETLLGVPHLLVLMLAAFALLILTFVDRKRWSWSQVALGLFLVTSFLHVMLARVGWLFRYEAYLVFMGVIVVAIALDEQRTRLWRPALAWRSLALAALLAVFVPLGHRAASALVRTPWASKNIHDQQIQMGTFIARYYRGAGVGANDVGAISYLGEVRTLDLFGLADFEVGRLKLYGVWNTEAMRQVTRERDVEVAVIYDEWFERYGGVPREWVKAGEWTIAHNVVCGSDRVAWYAVDPAESAPLLRHLRDFSSQLPTDVAQSGAYRNP